MHENEPKPRWLDKVPRCSSKCRALSGKCVQRIGEMGGESGAVCLPYVRQMAEENERLERELAEATQAQATADIKAEHLRKCNIDLIGQLAEAKETTEALERELNTKNYACGDAINKLWADIILKRKPEYGDWEYPGFAYRHIMCEVKQMVAEGRRAGMEEAKELCKRKRAQQETCLALGARNRDTGVRLIELEEEIGRLAE